MEPLAISWLIASSSSPLVAVLALWTIYVFHTYRRRWRTVDLFLLAFASQELVTSIFIFCYAIITLINPPFKTPCNITQWGLISTRTFQILTLTSMVVDRSLTVRWPYRYRFSVRRNQIRYHIAVLALVSVLVGVAAIFAKLPKTKQCVLHPGQWDVRFVIFLLSFYGVLVLISLVCTVQVEIHRQRHGSKTDGKGQFQLPECASPELHSATGMNSPLDTQSSTGSTRALHRPTRQASRRPYARHAKASSDLRWPPVAISSLVCYTLNHIPYLVLMSMAAYSPFLWSPWHEGILAWLRLAEGMLVPLLLFFKDHPLRTALRRSFQRRSGALSPLVGDDGPFQMYFDKDHFRKRGTFGSVTPIGIITNYRRTPGKKQRTRTKHNGKYTLPGLHNGDSVLAKSCFSAGFLSTEPLSKLSCADLTSLEMWREDEEENFYASLSDDFSTFSCKSADDSALSEDMRISEELYGGSFTTIANDDFEFHDTRPCGGEVRMKPALTFPVHNESFNGKISRNVSFKEHAETGESTKTNLTYEKTPFDFSQNCPDIFAELDHESKPSKTQENKYDTISRHRSTSYSMNDLDLIHKGMESAAEVETTFVLPVKSESTMSLYRLNVEPDLDHVLTPSKSENNVNGDSGFGSGAQSTNPVWSGFLCRKPSDPFWNMRKPSQGVGMMPAKNYPGILHPRMRKIPWISAWKKLDESPGSRPTSVSPDLVLKENDDKNPWEEHDRPKNPVEPDVDDAPQNDRVDEDLFDSNIDYNVFAKERGVLLENAYGKIVRDKCGVKVNFYGDAEDESESNDASPNENLFDYRFDGVGYRPTNGDVDRIYDARSQMVESLFCNDLDLVDANQDYYANLFEPNKLYREKETKTGVERRSSRNNRRNGEPCLELEIDSPYGQLYKVANKQDYFSDEEYNSQTKEPSCEIRRKLSDSRIRKPNVKRRDSRHSVKKSQDSQRKAPSNRYPSRNDAECRNRDFGFRNFDYGPARNGIARRESQTRKDDAKDGQKHREEVYGEPNAKDKRLKIERRESQTRLPKVIDSNRKTSPVKYGIYRRESQSKRSKETKSEGLWANASQPFYVSDVATRDNDNVSFRENYELQRSSKDANIYFKSDLARRESKNQNERPNVRRKTGAAVREPKDKPYENGDRCKSDYQWAQGNAENDLDDFIKFRDKCEDNFSHIQNLNRERANDAAKLDNLIYGVKSSKNEVYPFETFQEHKQPVYVPNYRTALDINENCRQKRLAITDFL